MPKSKTTEKARQSIDRNAHILKEISKELVHLENMASRVQELSTRYIYRSYIERILLRIDYTQRAFKELRERVRYEDVFAEMCEEERRGSKGENTKG